MKVFAVHGAEKVQRVWPCVLNVARQSIADLFVSARTGIGISPSARVVASEVAAVGSVLTTTVHVSEFAKGSEKKTKS